MRAAPWARAEVALGEVVDYLAQDAPVGPALPRGDAEPAPHVPRLADPAEHGGPSADMAGEAGLMLP